MTALKVTAQRPTVLLGRWLMILGIFTSSLAVGLWISGRQQPTPGRSASSPGTNLLAMDIYEFSTLAEMVATSDLVFRGTVLSEAQGRVVGEPERHEFRYQEIYIQVDRVFRGEPASVPVLIEQPGWRRADGQGWVRIDSINGLAAPGAGEAGYFFLTYRSTSSPRKPAYALATTEQSMFLLAGGRIQSPNDIDPWVINLNGLGQSEFETRLETAAQKARDGLVDPVPPRF